MLKQITVCIPNTPGQLAEVASALADKDININAFHLANMGRSGFVQVVCAPHALACQVLLQKYQNRAFESDIIGVRAPNEPGQLLKAVDILKQQYININNSYMTVDADGVAIILIELEYAADLERALKALKKCGIELVDESSGLNG